MKNREYCCCAIPIINAGILATLIEQLAVAAIVGTLSIATPSIVGANTPSFAPWVLAAVCYVLAAIQVLGIIGVSREKPQLYKRYVMLHGLAMTAAFSIAAVWIILSAVGHDSAKKRCLSSFFTANDGTISSEGDTLCTIFPWVDVGIMGGLWVLLGAVHIYFFVVVSSYGKTQRRDHDQYDKNNDPSQPLTTEAIPLQDTADAWDPRQSIDYLNDGRPTQDYKHVRQESAASVSDVINQRHQEPKDTLSSKEYAYGDYNANPDVAHPSYAYTQDPAVTPSYQSRPDNYNYNQYGVDPPQKVQAHPAEGSFGRKTPRFQ